MDGQARSADAGDYAHLFPEITGVDRMSGDLTICCMEEIKDTMVVPVEIR